MWLTECKSPSLAHLRPRASHAETVGVFTEILPAAVCHPPITGRRDVLFFSEQTAAEYGPRDDAQTCWVQTRAELLRAGLVVLAWSKESVV